jgi:hypothetical protein
MGYEMIFPPVQSVSAVKDLLLKLRSDANDLRKAGSLLRKQGINDLGKWISRCHRLDIDFERLLTAMDGHQASHGDSLIEKKYRLLLIKRVVDLAKDNSDATIIGFKVTDTLFEEYLSFFPSASFVYILRDPRDIFASLKERNFGLSLKSACKIWCKGIQAFDTFQASHSEKCKVIRYEDLVSNPIETTKSLFNKLQLAFEEATLNFHLSQARILNSSHPNAPNLKKGFFDSSVNRYISDLSFSESKKISRLCRPLMEKYGYEATNSHIQDGTNGNKLYSLSIKERTKKQIGLNSKKKYVKDQYSELIQGYTGQGYEVMTLLDFIRKKKIEDRKVLVVRHDVDHDYMTAMKMAEWEKQHGIRSTYCLLHTAWYYGRLEGNTIRHTENLVDCAQQIKRLGHEINLHNNLAVTALKHAIDPEILLRNELEFFNSIGIQIRGTSTHGDILCRDFNFRNYELFREICDGRYGGPRCIIFNDGNKRSTVTLGELSMYDFGLEYEAYEIFWDIYHTDSGGKLQVRKNRRGMRHFGRTDPNRGSLVGILTHPIWWQF